MKRFIKYGAAALLLSSSQLAFAQYVDGSEDNTDAGTEVENIVSVTYEVDGNVQDAVDNTVPDTDGDGTPDGLTFKVDRVILVAVAGAGGASVAPNEDDKYLTFTVTNDSNNNVSTNADGFAADDAYLDIVLSTADTAATDDFDASLQIWLDTNGNGTLDTTDPDAAGPLLADTQTSVIDNAEEEDTFTVFVLGDIPGSAADGDTDSVYLIATVHETDGANGTAGAAVVETTTADDPDAMDTVFGDEDGDAAGTLDAARDGAHTDVETFTVASADITVAKSMTVISDPFNGVGNGSTVLPKAIPGAIIEYCILITNNGAQAADSVAVSDAIPANTTYFSSSSDTLDETGEAVDSSIRIADDCAGTNAAYEDNDATGADDTTGPSGNFDSGTGANGTVNTQVPSLPSTEATATIFRVTVD